MFNKIRSKRAYLTGAAALLAIVVVAALATPQPASAHCDSEQGPVATAARQALDKADVKLVLPYVQPAAEKELTAAFQEALAVRKSGGHTKGTG